MPYVYRKISQMSSGLMFFFRPFLFEWAYLRRRGGAYLRRVLLLRLHQETSNIYNNERFDFFLLFLTDIITLNYQA